MPKVPHKHTKSEFNGESNNTPWEIRAHADGIQIDVFFEGEEDARTIHLEPRHISSIVSMNEDWWESHWAALHEEQA